MDTPDGLPIRAFADASALRDWLAEHHEEGDGFWLKIPKKGSGEPGPVYGEALDEALCYGWIDSQKRKFDDKFYLQRFTRRTRRSKWSKINRKKVAALIEADLMEPAGLAEVDAAKADGRWAAAYDSPSTAKVPPDLQAALEAEPAALAFFEELNSSNRFAILSQIQDAKRDDTRVRRIEKYVAMCARGETVY